MADSTKQKFEELGIKFADVEPDVLSRQWSNMMQKTSDETVKKVNEIMFGGLSAEVNHRRTDLAPKGASLQDANASFQSSVTQVGNVCVLPLDVFEWMLTGLNKSYGIEYECEYNDETDTYDFIKLNGITYLPAGEKDK
jgi:hypothetical protein